MDYNELKRQEESRRRWIAYMEQGGKKTYPHELWESKARGDELFLQHSNYITMLFVVSALVLGIVLGAVGTLVFTQERVPQQREMVR